MNGIPRHLTQWYARLYERAEEAYGEGLSLDHALQAVRDGYSSAEFDKQYREEEQ